MPHLIQKPDLTPNKLLPLSPPPPPCHSVSRPLPPGYYYLHVPCAFQKIPAIDSYNALMQPKPEKAVAKSPIPTTTAADGGGRPAVKSTRLNRRSRRVCVEERRGPRSMGLAWAPKKPKSYEVVGKRVVGSSRPPPSPLLAENGVVISGKTTFMIRNFPDQTPKETKSVHEVVGKCVAGSSSPPASPPLPENGVPISGKTTVMIRNVPNQFSRDKLLAFLDSLCFDQNKKTKLESKPLRFEYDFVYLPMDFRSGNNLGYAFVNFTDAVAARRIKGLLDYYSWGCFHSKKICEIKWANIQGKEELVRHFQNRIFACRDPRYLPIVLSPTSDGAAFTFPTIIGKCLKSA